MSLPVNGVVHLEIKVDLEEVTVNGVAEWVRKKRTEVMGALLCRVVLQAQEAWLEQVASGEAELVCTGCGVIHEGKAGWVRRGTRERKVKTSSGEIGFPLVQVTCGGCEKTRAPCAEALGLGSRQRITAEFERMLVERVPDLSYRRSVRTVRDCTGSSVSPSTLHRRVQARAEQIVLTPDPACEIVMADGTKVRSGSRTEFEDLRLAFQVQGHGEEGGRPKARLRFTGVGVGRKTWPKVLPGDSGTKLVVTDAEPALQAHVRERYPHARHQLCEWHVAYTLSWSLRNDKVPAAQRKELQQELGSILWCNASQKSKRMLYEAFTAKLSYSPASQKQLRQAAPFILYEDASAETTTSLLERQMREVDRRVYIGVRWSDRGVENLMRLSMARTHNPDDYDRIWRS